MLTAKISAYLVVQFLSVLSVQSYIVPSRAANSVGSTALDVSIPLSVVSIKLPSYNGYTHFCSGSILSDEWILTAGHCFTDKHGIPPELFVVDVGGVHLSGNDSTRYNVADIIIHPNQSQTIQIYRHDLCLVKLTTSILFTSAFQAVRVGSIEDQKELPVLAGGWGRVSQHGELNEVLRYVEFDTLPFGECQRLHEERNNIVDPENHICGYKGLGTGLCFGDSGGPLFDLQTELQVGVFSTMEDCSGNFPDLFMKVERYLDWINSVTELNLQIN